jgi:3D-(3,5/4)-trihydroxycyclohexane-1,2-dione acylhydrolase (decyclizing)
VAETAPHRYGPSSDVWWDVAPAEVTNDAETQEARKAYEADRQKSQRFHY